MSETIQQFCERRGIHPPLVAVMKLWTDHLDDAELAAQYLAATAGFDPRPVAGYDKIKGLFTSDPPRWRSDDAEILGLLVGMRPGIMEPAHPG